MKKQIVFLIITIITTILLLTSITYAWLILYEKSNPILVVSGSLDLKSNLYLINADNTLEPISTKNEDNVVPGQEFLYKLDLTNGGTTDGLLNIKFNFEFTEEDNKDKVFLKVATNQELTTGIKYDSSIDNEITILTDQEIASGSEFVIYFKISFSGLLENILDENYIYLSQIHITLNQKAV